MRIVDTWKQGDMNVTVFKMNARFSVKIELGLLEQTYKFRDQQFSDLASLKSVLNDTFFMSTKRHFIDMMELKTSLLPTEMSSDNFPEII